MRAVTYELVSLELASDDFELSVIEVIELRAAWPVSHQRASVSGF